MFYSVGYQKEGNGNIHMDFFLFFFFKKKKKKISNHLHQE